MGTAALQSSQTWVPPLGSSPAPGQQLEPLHAVGAGDFLAGPPGTHWPAATSASPECYQCPSPVDQCPSIALCDLCLADSSIHGSPCLGPQET